LEIERSTRVIETGYFPSEALLNTNADISDFCATLNAMQHYKYIVHSTNITTLSLELYGFVRLQYEKVILLQCSKFES
jgi:hypothetical protein